MEKLRAIRLGKAETTMEKRPDGSFVIRSKDKLGDYSRVITERLIHWAKKAPDRILFAQRAKDGSWRSVTYGQALSIVESLGQAMIDRKLSAERPVAILSENDIEHALISLAGSHVGVPTSAISTAYSLISTDFGKLRHVFDILTPGLVFAASGKRFQRALETIVPQDCEIALTEDPIESRAVTLFKHLAATKPTQAVEEAFKKVTGDTVCKFLFTSGSTGIPKAVINTQRMMCSNQQMLLRSFPFLEDEPPVLLDWLPWSHTFGGNHNFNMAVNNGGSLYIDDGRPLPGLFDRTINNLRDVAPTIYFNVPKGFEELLPRLRADRELAKKFFSRLKFMFYAGAGISLSVWNGLRELALEVCGERVLILTSLGSTETAPASTTLVVDTEKPGEVGIPMAGVELKLVPSDEKLELRIKGPNITPGYWRQPDMTADSFDEEGFYKMGDALKFVEPGNADRGFMFDGRIAEDFKLATGTWVSVGPLRAKLIGHFAPFMRDCVITGHDRDDVGMLAVPDIEMCRRLVIDLPHDAPADKVLIHHSVQDQFRDLLKSFAAQSTGSANRIARMTILAEPPSLYADKAAPGILTL
jgi:feruloyl-CoA synthase